MIVRSGVVEIDARAGRRLDGGAEHGVDLGRGQRKRLVRRAGVAMRNEPKRSRGRGGDDGVADGVEVERGLDARSRSWRRRTCVAMRVHGSRRRPAREQPEDDRAPGGSARARTPSPAVASRRLRDETRHEALAIAALERDLVIAHDDAAHRADDSTALPAARTVCYSRGRMDWRRLEASRPVAAALAASELRPSIRDFTQYLGVGRRAVAVDPAAAPSRPRHRRRAVRRARRRRVRARRRRARDSGARDRHRARELGLDGLRPRPPPPTSAPVLRYDCIASDDRLYESRARRRRRRCWCRSRVAADALAAADRARARRSTSSPSPRWRRPPNARRRCARAPRSSPCGRIALALAGEIPPRYPGDSRRIGDRLDPRRSTRLLGVVDARDRRQRHSPGARPRCAREALADARGGALTMTARTAP